MFTSEMTIAGFDPELAKAIADERNRQEDHIELIASENYASPRVLEAQGSVLTNKYAEGYPGKRYYGGCEFVDVAEQLAIDRAKQLFGADYANVQPHSGSQANAAVYLAMLNPGDTILGMSLDHGGHLTHGAKVNFSGKLFKAVQYGIKSDSGEIDYAEFYSNYPSLDVPDVHYPGSSNDPNATTNGCSSAARSTAGAFNTYALSWTPSTITTYFNGVACTTDTYSSYVTSPDAAPEPFDQPFFLAFTSALGMNNGDSFEPGTTPLPASMRIDWVRV